MNNIIDFGKYEGKTMEWLFFKAPWYVEWMKYKGVHRQEHIMSDEQGNHFQELYTRASHLTGICRWCRARQITRMGLSTQYGSGALGSIGFYCDKCEYTGGSPTDYYEPSFFMPYEAPRCEQRRLTSYIKNRYIGNVRLTQEKMEEFFQNDDLFIDGTPGFFRKEVAV